jgi:hypothetical protein
MAELRVPLILSLDLYQALVREASRRRMAVDTYIEAVLIEKMAQLSGGTDAR